MEEPLQLMVELQGDSLRASPGPARAAVEQRIMAAFACSDAAQKESRQTQPGITQLTTCTGCKTASMTLLKCGACKQA